MGDERRDTLNELLDGILEDGGCSTVLLWIIIVILFVLAMVTLWVLFTTPAPPVEPPLDPSYLQGIPGFGGDTPTPLPSESSIPW